MLVMSSLPRGTSAFSIALLFMGAVLACDLYGADSPARFLTVTNWHATFTRTLSSEGQFTAPDGCVYQWNVSHSGTLRTELHSFIVLPLWSDIGVTNQLSFSLNDHSSQTCNDNTDNYASTVPNPQAGNWTELRVDVAQTNYSLSIGYLVSVVESTVNGDPFPGSVVMWYPFMTNALVEPLPASGMVLEGRRAFLLRELPYESLAPLLTVGANASPVGIDLKQMTGEIVVTWTLRPEEEEVEAVMEIPQYDNWLPEGDVNEENPGGNPLEIILTLQRPDGTPAQVRAEKFVIELSEVSKEPGLCMNFPTNTASGAQPRADLRFEQDMNGTWTIQEGEIRMETKEADPLSARAVLSSYDWGGYGVLKAKAILPGGEEIEAHLKGQRNITEVRVPKRKADSYIGDAWLKDYSLNNPNHGADDENNPEGDGHRGDGLSLYEEYRGFYEGGTGAAHHIFGDPERKDFFVLNKLGTARGIAQFATESGLVVHSSFLESEIKDRVINFNRSGSAPHVVDQHVVILERGPIPNSTADGKAYGGPSVPKNISRVVISDGFNLNTRPVAQRGGAPSVDPAKWIVAHELAHCCNVPHHGPSYTNHVLWTGETIDGVLTWQENGSAIIDVFSDPAIERILPANDSDHRVLIVGHKGNLGSGDEDCIMRYPNHAHAWVGSETTRFLIERDDEKIGTTYCNSKQGTGVNGVEAGKPWPRFGNATVGECKKHFCVNDLMNHPPGRN